MDTWELITEKVRDSVVQIMVTYMDYDLDLPYRQPELKSARGSGFVVGVTREKIIIMTNAHVVENSVAIKVRFNNQGQKDYSAELLKFVYFRDLALITLPRNIISDIKPLEFDDSVTIKSGQPIMALGFPLGKENIQSAIGNISGTQSEKSNVEDQDIYDEMSYAQITAPINPGNSGGPVFNLAGKVIGIASAGYIMYQNIGFMITSRSIFSVLYAMFSVDSLMLYPARLGFEWNERPSGTSGIYIREVYPSSCFFRDPGYQDDLFENLRRTSKLIGESDKQALAQEASSAIQSILQRYSPQRWITKIDGLQEGDILLSLTIPNYYLQWFRSPTRLLFENPDNLRLGSNENIVFEFDNLGSSKFDSRTILLQEIEDMIPMGAPITATIIRDNQTLTVSRFFIDQDVVKWMIRRVYPRFEPQRVRFTVLAGMVLVSSPSSKTLKAAGLNYNQRFGRYLFVSYVFAGTELDRLHILKRGEILTHINGNRVKSIDDISKIPVFDNVEFRFKSQIKITLSMKQIQDDDRYVKETFNITY